MAKQAPPISELAGQVAGAMVAAEPVEPLGWVVARDAEGKALYLVAVVMGRENVEDFAEALTKLKPGMKRVDLFDGTPGEPAPGGPAPGETPDAPNGRGS